MRIYILYISISFVGILYGCQASKKMYHKLIIGTWEEVNHGFYPKIEFYEKDVVFYTTGDTILTYSYTINRNKLILTDRNNDRKSNKIIELSNISLKFETLLENKTVSGYIKSK